MERNGFSGRGRGCCGGGGGRGGGRGKGRDGQGQQQQQQQQRLQEQQRRGSNRGWSGGRLGPIRGGVQQEQGNDAGPSQGTSTSSSGRAWGTAVPAGPSQGTSTSSSGRAWGTAVPAGSSQGTSTSSSVIAAGRSFAQVVSSQTNESSSSRRSPVASVSRTMASLRSSTVVPPSSASLSSPVSKETLRPMERPDAGGTHAVKRHNLLVNHFAVKFDPEKIIWHYDFDVKSKLVPSNGHPVKVSKSDLSLIQNQMSVDNPKLFPLEMIAYDGKRSIFSAEMLPIGDFTVQLSVCESSYLVTVKLVNELRLSQLNAYLSEQGLVVPRSILQGMDLAMKKNSKRCVISLSNGSPIKFHQGVDLGHGIIVVGEPKHSLKLTSQGLALCADYLVLPFRKSLPVIQYLEQQGFRINEFGRFKDKIESALKGVEVYKTHLDTNRRHKIAGLTSKNAQDITFCIKNTQCKTDGNSNCIEKKQVKLVDYFKGKHGKDIIHKDIPCLELGKKNGSQCVPMEFCVVAEGQRYPEELLVGDAEKQLKNLSVARPEVRRKLICHMVQAKDGPFRGEVLQNFGMEVDMNMTNVVGRVLGPPDLVVRAPGGRKMAIKVDREKCHWNLVGKCLLEGKQIDRWAVLDFISFKSNEDFIARLRERCNNLGIQMGEPLHYETAIMDNLNDMAKLRMLLDKIQRLSEKKAKGRIQILLCVMAKQHPGYNCLKFISETKVGIMTQCCLPAKARNGTDQYLANLGLKINTKLGGLNVEINKFLLQFKCKSPVMFVGADVNHPGFKKSTCPSIAAVVASMSWPAPNRYAARIRPQDPRSEMIQDFAEMCLELLEAYVKLNKDWPAQIIIFRDGVSDTQFDMVLKEEFLAVKRAFEAIKYFPTITVVVARKRHHTRFFLATERKEGSSGNVPPGTIIDTTVVDHSGFDCYLVSQYGSIGTSKPTHYSVLWDENGFTSDDIHQLIYSMCFTFARSTKPVSLIPPVYYADLAAYRGRLYQEALDRMSQGPSTSSSPSFSASSPSQASAAAFDQSSYKVHPDLENSMFFL